MSRFLRSSILFKFYKSKVIFYRCRRRTIIKYTKYINVIVFTYKHTPHDTRNSSLTILFCVSLIIQKEKKIDECRTILWKYFHQIDGFSENFRIFFLLKHDLFLEERPFGKNIFGNWFDISNRQINHNNSIDAFAKLYKKTQFKIIL